MLAPPQWLNIRKKLYLKLKEEVRRRHAPFSPDLQAYEQAYEREFQKKWRVSERSELDQAVAKADVLCLADFHSLSQAQKVQHKLLQAWSKARSVVLAVEFFESRDQDLLDAFLASAMGEEEFLEEIQWCQRWGFPWSHYRPLMIWAKQTKTPVFAVNRHYRQRKASYLEKRDRHSARLIHHLVREYSDSLIVVIYGELHLAQSHLPAELTRLAPHLKLLRVFQNSESLYFKLAARGLENEVDYVRLGRASFCVMGVAPWVKWQNYLMFLEQVHAVSPEDDEDDIDYTDDVGRFALLLSQALNQFVSLDHLSVYTTSDEALEHHLDQVLTRTDEVMVKKLIASEVSFFMPSVNIGVLARPSVNHAAHLGAQYVHAQLCKSKTQYWNLPKSFLQQIWIQTVAYFGSKLLNPKRKTPMLLDLQQAVRVNGDNAGAREVLVIALDQKMRDLVYLKRGRSLPRKVKYRGSKAHYDAARLLGGILGEKLYAGYQMNKLSRKVLVELLLQPMEVGDFAKFYYSMIEQVEPLPVYFKSKNERL